MTAPSTSSTSFVKQQKSAVFSGDRSPRLWITLSVWTLLISSVIAFSQSARNPADQAAAVSSGDTLAGWLFYPVEENPPLARIETDLNAVYALDEQRIWAVGNLGLIVHSEDGGRTWTQQRVSTDSPPPTAPTVQATASPLPTTTSNTFTEAAPDTSTKSSNSTAGATSGNMNRAPTQRPQPKASQPRRTQPRPKKKKITDSVNLNRKGKDFDFAHASMPDTPAPVERGGNENMPDSRVEDERDVIQDANPPFPVNKPVSKPTATPQATPFEPKPRTFDNSSAPTPTATPRRNVSSNRNNRAGTAQVTATRPTATPQPSSTPDASSSPQATASPQASPTPLPTPLPEDLLAVIFNGAQYGWIAGRNGTVYSTPDGGQHWYVTASKLPAEGESVENPSFSSAPATASAPFRIQDRWYRLTNDGQLKLISIPVELSDIYKWYLRNYGRARENMDRLVPEMRVLATDNRDTPQIRVGKDGKICVDTPETECKPVASGTDKDLRAVEFIDSANAAWIVGDDGTILHSRDGGASWKPQTSYVQGRLNGVDFLPDGRHGWAVGYNGILATSDGGAHWVRAAVGPDEVPSTGTYKCSWPRWYYLSWPLAGLLLLPALRRRDDVLPPDESVADVLVSDRPLEAGDPDPLQFHTIALGLSRFLRNERTLPPLTIAITGEWGTGKSSLMNLLRSDLRQYGFRPVWFNAWHHQKEEHLLASLLQNIRMQAIPRIWRPVGIMFRARLLLIRGWRHWMPVLLLLFIAALLAGYAVARFNAGGTDANSLVTLIRSFFNFKLDDISQTAPRLALLASVVSVLVAAWKGVTAFGVNPASLLATVSSSMRLRDLDAQTCFRKKFADEFNDVTSALGQRSMIIFIDDLDRCRPENVLDTLEAVNFLVSSGDCFVVIGMARERVERCVGLSFKDVAEEVLGSGVVVGGAKLTQKEAGDDARLKRGKFASEYLDKLINIEVPVPVPTAEQSRELLIVPNPSPLPELLRRWQQARTIGVRVWPVAVAALILSAGAYAGLRMHGRLHAPSGEKPNVIATATASPPAATTNATPDDAAATTVDPDVTEPAPDDSTSATASPTPFDEAELRKQNQKANLTAATPARRPLLSYWPLPLGVLALLGVAVWLLTRRPDLVVKDSEEFEAALRIWHPLVFSRHKTPRSLKRFMNRVRYLAMRQRAQQESQSRWERVAAYLARRSGIELPSAIVGGDDAETRMPESALVALAAIQQFVPGWLENKEHFEQSIIRNIVPDKHSADALAPLRDAKNAHEEKFGDWRAIEKYRDAFLKMSADIRVN